MKIINFGIYLIVFLLPSYLIKFSIFGIPTTVLELLIWIVFGLWIIGKIIKKDSSHNPSVSFETAGFSTQDGSAYGRSLLDKLKFTIPEWLNRIFFQKTGFELPIILFIIAAIISTIISPDKIKSLGIFKAWIIDPILLFYLITNSIKTEKEKLYLFWSLFLSGFFVALAGLLQYIWPYQPLQGIRLTAFYNSPNALSLYLVPIFCMAFAKIVLSLPLSLRTTPNFPREHLTVSICLASVIFSVIILTISRGGYLGALAGMVFVGIVKFWKFFQPRRWLLPIFLLVLIIILISIYPFFARLETADNIRISIWKDSFVLIKNHPILGVGLGYFQQAFAELTKHKVNYPQFVIPNAVTPHNLYLAFWLNMGLLGLIAFLWIVIQFFRMGFRNLKLSTIDYRLSIYLISAMVAILTHGLVDTPFWKNDLSCLFWIIVGMMVVTEKLYEKSAENGKKTPK